MKLIMSLGILLSTTLVFTSCSTVSSAANYLEDRYHTATHFDTNNCNSYKATEATYCEKQKAKEVSEYSSFTPNQCNKLKPIMIGNERSDYPKKACGRVLYDKIKPDYFARYNEYSKGYSELEAAPDSEEKLKNISSLSQNIEKLIAEDNQYRIDLYFASEELNSKIDNFKSLQDACYKLKEKTSNLYNKTLSANEQLKRNSERLQEANIQKAYDQKLRLEKVNQQKAEIQANQKNLARIQSARQSNPSEFKECEELAAELREVGKQLQSVNTNVISEAKTKEAKAKMEKLAYKVDVLNEKLSNKNCQKYY